MVKLFLGKPSKRVDRVKFNQYFTRHLDGYDYEIEIQRGHVIRTYRGTTIHRQMPGWASAASGDRFVQLITRGFFDHMLKR